MKHIPLSLLAVALMVSAAHAKTYDIDPNHSSITFTIKHLVGRVAGHFDKFAGTFDYDAKNPKVWKTSATIETTSINTGIGKRDDHLRTPEFFDAQKYPTISFKSTGISDVKDNTALLTGDLTLHGVTKPVTLKLEIGGTVKDPMGTGERAGATATGKINRKDFGIAYDQSTNTGVRMIGEDVDLVLNIEGVSKK